MGREATGKRRLGGGNGEGEEGNREGEMGGGQQGGGDGEGEAETGRGMMGRGATGWGRWGGREGGKHTECLGGMRLHFFLTLFTRATPGIPASLY